MMKGTSLLAALSLLCGSSSTTESFSPSPQSSVRKTTSLNLKPEQGCQLAAAFEATLLPPSAASGSASSKTPTNVARAIVSRIFSLPATLRHPHLSETLINDKESDIVHYPVVGFEFVNGQPLPTMARAACRIHPESHDEELYGWFTPACPLQSLESYEYCKEPLHEI